MLSILLINKNKYLCIELVPFYLELLFYRVNNGFIYFVYN